MTVIERIKSRKIFFISLLLITIIANIGFYWLFKNIENFDEKTVSLSLKVFLVGFILIGLVFKYQKKQ